MLVNGVARDLSQGFLHAKQMLKATVPPAQVVTTHNNYTHKSNSWPIYILSANTNYPLLASAH